MAKKANYSIIMAKDNSKVEVQGEMIGFWGIHKREDKLYALTHLDTGMLVCSAEKKKCLVALLEDPEFKEECWGPGKMPSRKDVDRLSKVIGEFYSKKC